MWFPQKKSTIVYLQMNFFTSLAARINYFTDNSTKVSSPSIDNWSWHFFAPVIVSLKDYIYQHFVLDSTACT